VKWSEIEIKMEKRRRKNHVRKIKTKPQREMNKGDEQRKIIKK
jgi:hypothetical protein